MRISLATTLKNRQANTDKDPRLLNCVVDSKKRVLKRPSLVGTYEVTTPGAGLGLFVRTTPGAPGVPATPELVTIVGSILTTSPSAQINETHTLVATQADVEYVGFDLIGTFPGSSITPSTYNGTEIRALYCIPPSTDETLFGVAGVVAQDFFTSILLNGVTLLSADATFTTGTNSQWEWPGVRPITVAGTYPVVIA